MNPLNSLVNNGFNSLPSSQQLSGEDNLSLMSETSDESFVENNTLQKYYVERGVNTEDTFRLVAFEVDQWANKCIRNADEFQTSRSFEDAQSNISELEESLGEYLKLRKSDGTLRVDLLLYVILANIIDGLEANSHIFTSEVPSISKILAKCFLTSGQLGRYGGFQSFKQSVKAIRFLQEYYRKRDLKPDKLPIILWQSVKKISLKGTTPYPTLHPAEFHFHLENCPDSESCKSLRLDFGDSTPIVLKHCTSTQEIVEALKFLSNQNLDFGCDHVQPKLELANRTPFDNQHGHSAGAKHCDITLQQMVVCDIDLGHSSENKLLICDILQSQPKYSKAFQQFQQNYGGSVVIRFKSRYFNGERKYSDKASFYTLGTKQYWEKHTQIVLIDVNNDDIVRPDSILQNDVESQNWLVADLNGRKVQEAEKIEDIQSLKWDLKFGSCPAGCWTYPEVHFVEKLVLLPLLEDCSISFEDHVCQTDTNLSGKCSDCKLLDGISSSSNFISVDQVFESGSVQINVRLDLKRLGLLSTSTESVSCNSNVVDPVKFALFKFAMSIQLDLRGLLIELDKESKIRTKKERGGLLEGEAFKEILKLWEAHKDYYYALWYTH